MNNLHKLFKVEEKFKLREKCKNSAFQMLYIIFIVEKYVNAKTK